VEGHTIRLKDGAQAYTATFYGQPEIAKKNVAKIFLSVDDGGHYERIFSPDMTAEKVVIAHTMKEFIDDFVRDFTSVRRRALASGNVVEIYEPVLGAHLTATHSDVIHQVMPQCSLFLCGTIFKDLTGNQKMEPSKIPDWLATDGKDLIREHLLQIIDFAKSNKDKADKSWPVLLKSNTFFTHITAYQAGIRKALAKPANGSPPTGDTEHK
jgi:hypothetical protein